MFSGRKKHDILNTRIFLYHYIARNWTCTVCVWKNSSYLQDWRKTVWIYIWVEQ